ncbi:nuclease-related domain-containing protein [Neobacillus niacini]|uniref:nuclease-related domain-containing protein n=1 Tax=Neobacillus niacini TaxID=86668 RepID=UPI002FFE9127
MIIQQRPEPLEIQIFRVLFVRLELSENKFTINEKGYEGELRSDKWLEGLTDHWHVLHGLLLEYNGSRFQIDTLIIAHEKIYILDVKNYEGDYYLEGDKWYTKTNPNLKNPLHQLIRCETLLRKLLLELGYNYPIESYLIFNNPEFHLYLTTFNPPIVFPAQLNRFLKKLNSRLIKLNSKHHKLAQQLASLHIVESPFSRLPPYTFEQLIMGILCPDCRRFFQEVCKDIFICGHCGCKEGVDAAVLRNVKEYRMLFPDRKITTKDIYEWCGCMLSKKVIRRILLKNFKLKGFGPSSNFE